MPGLLRALAAFAAFMLAWTPYRALTALAGVEAMRIMDLVFKPGITLLVVLPLARRWGVPLGRLISRPSSYAVGLALGAAYAVPLSVLGGLSPGPDWLGLASAFLVVGPFEELFDRGLVYPLLRREMGVLSSTLISSALFSMSHVPIDVLVWGMGPAETANHLFWVFLSSLSFCLAMESERSLWAPAALHSAVDAPYFLGRVGWSVQLGVLCNGLCLAAALARLRARRPGEFWEGL